MAENKLTDLSMDFAVQTLQLCETIHSHSTLVNQLERSSTSIGANIREASYAHGKADFIAKLQIALKECYETEYWLELFQRAGIADLDSIDPLQRHDPANAHRLRQHREEKPHMTCPSTPWAGFSFTPPHTPGAPSRAASSRRDRPLTSVSKQSAHTVSPPRTHGHRYASAHDGSGAKHTSHRRICVPPPFICKVIMHSDNFLHQFILVRIICQAVFLRLHKNCARLFLHARRVLLF